MVAPEGYDLYPKRSYVRQSGTYKGIRKAYRKQNGVWTPITNLSVHHSDVFQNMIQPENYPRDALAIFSESVRPLIGWISAGYDGYMPKLVSSLPGSLLTGGTDEHTHGDNTVIVSGTYSHSKTVTKNTVGSNGRNCTQSSHTHAIPVHNHGGNSNYPLCTRIAAYYNVPSVYEGMLVFSFDGAISSPGWDLVDVDTYVSIDNESPGAFLGSDDHTHTDYDFEGYYYAPTVTDTWQRDSYWSRSHTHYLKSVLSSVENNPYFRKALAYRASVAGLDVPSGSAILGHHTMASVPSGYSLAGLTDEDRLLRLTATSADSGVYGGAGGGHGHTDTTGEWQATAYDAQVEIKRTTTEKYRVLAHTHTWVHDHSAVTDEDATAPWVKVPLIIKD